MDSFIDLLRFIGNEKSLKEEREERREQYKENVKNCEIFFKNSKRFKKLGEDKESKEICEIISNYVVFDNSCPKCEFHGFYHSYHDCNKTENFYKDKLNQKNIKQCELFFSKEKEKIINPEEAMQICRTICDINREKCKDHNFRHKDDCNDIQEYIKKYINDTT